MDSGRAEEFLAEQEGSAHEGSFLQHTAVTPSPWREHEPVGGTLLLCGTSEKPGRLLEYFMTLEQGAFGLC